MFPWLMAIVIVANGHIRETTGDKGYFTEEQCKADIAQAQLIPLKKHAQAYFWCRQPNQSDWD